MCFIQIPLIVKCSYGTRTLSYPVMCGSPGAKSSDELEQKTTLYWAITKRQTKDAPKGRKTKQKV